MAVATNGNVVTLTAAGDKVSDAGFGRIKVKAVAWRGMALGNSCVLRDRSGGQAIYESQATADDDDDSQLIEGWLQDVYVDTLGGGTVYVYLE